MLGLAALLLPAGPASAGGGYGDDDAVCKATGKVTGYCPGYTWVKNGTEYSPRGYAWRNCTDFVAFRAAQAGVSITGLGNARDFDDRAAAKGWTVSGTPRVRAIAQTDDGDGDGYVNGQRLPDGSVEADYGHVAWVTSLNSDGTVSLEDYNAGGTGAYTAPRPFAVSRFRYIYIPGVTQTPTNVSQYANTIVKWSGDSVTSWFVTPDLKRLWIPDGGTYNQLKARGFAGPYVLDSTTLNQLPDQTGQWVASGSSWGQNRELRRGMSVRSSDGRYLFAMQNDGNLVLYGPSGRALWATSWKTSSWTAQEFVIFQGDGNLVTYGGGRAIWASNTGGRGGNHFEVQSDGNLVVYRDSTPLWASNTAGLT